MAPVQRDGFLPPTIDQLREQVADLEAELARAHTALDDAAYLAHRIQKLLSDHPDLASLARYIASSLDNDGLS